ncbi:ABC transporter permease [Peptoniphilus mikwangii]|uniref:ABC transporter permease n=1 Tax=Peptoniphilus mikwangii TaxID=1354300 RepID=UPI000413F9B7|nr:ABC transporter permease [Peptoniphilus mikwangii]
MKNNVNVNLRKIENKKFRGSFLFLVFLAFFTINGFFMSVVLFSSNFKNMFSSNDIPWNYALDFYFFIKQLLTPILIASIISKAVSIENDTYMWKFLKSCGVSFNKIYSVKFWNIYKKYLIYQMLEWIFLICISKFVGLHQPIPIFRFIVYFISQSLISFLLMSFHYVLSLKWENQLISISIAIIGTLVGLLSSLISKFICIFMPYSWYMSLSSIKVTMISEDKFVRNILPINYLPLILSGILGITIYLIGRNIRGDE